MLPKQVYFVLNLPYTMVIFQISMNVCNPPVSTVSVATLWVHTDVLVTKAGQGPIAKQVPYTLSIFHVIV